jgi:hypothetical protein
MKSVVMVLVLVMIMSSLALAGNNSAAKAAIHVRAHNAKAACNAGTINGCEEIVTTETGYSVDAFPVFYDLVEYLGVEYGVTWPAWTYSAAFTSCSDLVIGAIAVPGDGASHTWFNCQYNVALPSFLWLYADGPGVICPIPHPVSGGIYILDCAEGLDEPCGVFCAGVFGEVGDDPCEPCEPTATEPTTWGAIKSMFE